MKKRMALLGLLIARAAAIALIRWCDQYTGRNGKYSFVIEITPGKGDGHEADA